MTDPKMTDNQKKDSTKHHTSPTAPKLEVKRDNKETPAEAPRKMPEAVK